MHRAEMTGEQARAVLATAVRHHLASGGIIFSPWSGLDLSWRDGILFQGKSTAPLLSQKALMDGMSEEAIERAVLGLPAPPTKGHSGKGAGRETI